MEPIEPLLTEPCDWVKDAYAPLIKGKIDKVSKFVEKMIDWADRRNGASFFSTVYFLIHFH